MFIFLSKLLPIFIYPIGLTCILMLMAAFLPRQPRWQRGLIGLAFLVLWLSSSNLIAAPLVRSLEWRYLPPQEVPTAEVIVVLGGGTKRADYPRQTVELGEAGDRTLYAAWLYQQGKAEHLLLTGGNVFTDTFTTEPPEAEDMLSVMRMFAIPDEAIWLETKSRNSYENALFSRPLLEEKGINTILLVTSAIHMPRAVALFEKQGFKVIPLPTDFDDTQQVWQEVTKPTLQVQLGNFLPTVENLQHTTLAMKEYIGLLVYRWQGWL
jgi:uncharacterized SAM-binding protein YcdF (DUF218 family)